jgi:hypothetical protein
LWNQYRVTGKGDGLFAQLGISPRCCAFAQSTWSVSDLGGGVFASTPAGFAKLIAEGTEKWGKVIRIANIKLE